MPKGGRHGLPVHGGRGREHARTHTHTHTHTLTHTGVFFFSSSIVVAVDGSHPGQNRGPPIRAAQLLVFKRKEGEGGAKLPPPARVQAVGEALVMGRGACAPPAVAASTHHDGDDAPAVGREGDDCPGHLPVELFCVSMSPLRTTRAHLWMEIGPRRVAKLAAVALHKEVAWLDPAAPPPPHEPLNEVGSRVAGAPLPPLWVVWTRMAEAGGWVLTRRNNNKDAYRQTGATMHTRSTERKLSPTHKAAQAWTTSGGARSFRCRRPTPLIGVVPHDCKDRAGQPNRRASPSQSTRASRPEESGRDGQVQCSRRLSMVGARPRRGGDATPSLVWATQISKAVRL